MGQRKVYISCNHSSTISFFVKILLVKLKYLFIQFAWISIMAKQNSTWRCEGWKDGGTCQNLWPLPSQFSTFSIVLWSCKGIWKLNLDKNLHSTVWKALYNFKIKRVQEARHKQFFSQNVQNHEIFEVFKMFKKNSWINIYYTKGKYL